MPPKRNPGFRFVAVTATAAAEGCSKRSERSTSTVPARTAAAIVQLEKLHVADKDRDALRALYGPANQAPVDESFSAADDGQQTAASAMLCAHRLDLDSRELFDSKWRVQWSVKNNARQYQKDPIVRMLLQCACGYEHEQRATKTRKAALPYTACLAHAEITYHETSNRILRVRGHFEHNDACQAAEYDGVPLIPVHREVYAVALKHLALGSTLADLLEQNRALFQNGGYPSMPRDAHALQASKFRWELKPTDARALYRQHHRVNGVRVVEKPHINVDNWLDPSSPTYNKALHDAVFHYKARVAEGERFEICIATDEMKRAAWKYSHRKQMLLDGTFGICDSKMLLFIVMGLDDDRHGVPLAFLLFSAPAENKKTCAGYDTAVLTRLLRAWNSALGTRNGEAFEPLIVITDTDARERAALLAVWANVWLILCLFHLLQSWRNHRKKSLRGKAPYLSTLRERLRRVERDLIETVDFSAAKQLIAAERAALEALRTSAPSAISKAFEHLEYLDSYWLSESLWQSWSAYGRQRAAALMKCDVHLVLKTTNHLEGFNRVLKKKHLRRWQRSGRRLRIDVLVNVLALKIIPAIFAQRAQERTCAAALDAKILLLPGGERLLALRRANAQGSGTQDAVPVAYLSPDPERDSRAREMLDEGQISTPTVDDKFETFYFVCYSSVALEGQTEPTTYKISLHVSGLADCTCPDFQHQRTGACKHIRAALLKLDLFRDTHGHPAALPVINLPRTRQDALQLRSAVAQAIAPTNEGPALVARALDDVNNMLNFREREVYDAEPNPPSNAQDATDSDAASASGASDALGSDDDDDMLSDKDDNEYDILSGITSRAALDEQVSVRVCHELSRALPKLGDVEEHLSLMTMRPDSTELTHILDDAIERFRGIVTQLQRVRALPVTPPVPAGHRQASSPPPALVHAAVGVPKPTQSTSSAPKRPFGDISNMAGVQAGPDEPVAKRYRKDTSMLLPPPAEKAQTRKNSHSVV